MFQGIKNPFKSLREAHARHWQSQKFMELSKFGTPYELKASAHDKSAPFVLAAHANTADGAVMYYQPLEPGGGLDEAKQVCELSEKRFNAKYKPAKLRLIKQSVSTSPGLHPR